MTERTLTPEQHRILREQGTERPGSSPLNHEKRPGDFDCAGCGAAVRRDVEPPPGGQRTAAHSGRCATFGGAQFF